MSLQGLISKPVKDIFRFGKYLLPFFLGFQFFKHPLCECILLNDREFRCLLEGFFKQPCHNSPLFLFDILSCIVYRGKAAQKLFRQDITTKITGAPILRVRWSALSYFLFVFPEASNQLPE